MNRILQTTIQAKILAALLAILGILVGIVSYVSYQQHREEQEYKQTIKKAPHPDPNIGKSLKTADY